MRGVYGNARVRVGADAAPNQGNAAPVVIMGGIALLLIAVLRDEWRLNRR